MIKPVHLLRPRFLSRKYDLFGDLDQILDNRFRLAVAEDEGHDEMGIGKYLRRQCLMISRTPLRRAAQAIFRNPSVGLLV